MATAASDARSLGRRSHDLRGVARGSPGDALFAENSRVITDPSRSWVPPYVSF
jgi:hypothetical protein